MNNSPVGELLGFSAEAAMEKAANLAAIRGDSRALESKQPT